MSDKHNIERLDIETIPTRTEFQFFLKYSSLPSLRKRLIGIRKTRHGWWIQLDRHDLFKER